MVWYGVLRYLFGIPVRADAGVKMGEGKKKNGMGTYFFLTGLANPVFRRS